MKEIQLTQGKVAIVDDDDYEWLNQWKWYYHNGYAVYCVSRRHKLMHRIIMNTPNGMETDHINGDKLDNRRCNLRVCSRSENMQNQKRHVNNTSGFKGVRWHSSKWMVRINRDYLGLFTDLYEAAAAYNSAAIKYHGDFAKLNEYRFPDNYSVSLNYIPT